MATTTSANLGKIKPSGSEIPIGSHFPVPLVDNLSLANLQGHWCTYTGVLQCDRVLVTHPNDISILQSMGFHGMNTAQPKTNVPSLRNRHLYNEDDRLCPSPQLTETVEGMDDAEDDPPSPNCVKRPRLCPSPQLTETVEGMDDVEDDASTCSWEGEPWEKQVVQERSQRRDSDSLSSVEERASFIELRRPIEVPSRDRLVLSGIETIYLSHALGCLKVTDPAAVDTDKCLSLCDLWSHISGADQSARILFASRYAAYLHFRSRGWVVRHALRMAVDFLLYAEGPPYRHAAYSVLVVPKTVSRDHGSTSLSVAEVMLRLRVTESSSKKLLVCYVFLPDKFDPGSPECVRSVGIKEVVVDRWIPTQKSDSKPNLRNQEKDKHKTASSLFAHFH